MTVTITPASSGKHIFLVAPYTPDLPDKAHAIGGTWQPNAKNWVFDIRDEQRVRDLAREVYGTDGTPTETVTVHLTLSLYQRRERALFFGGREIASRRSRDERVRLGEGVVVIAGKFPSSGGSVKNPDIAADAGTVLEIRDIPAGHADLTADNVAVIDTAVDIDALTDERDRLIARLAEIDALLPAPEGTTATTEEAAQLLGVSVRTVQRWAARGKVDAVKSASGRWTVTITI